MSRPETYAELLATIERHVDDAHRLILRSVTDPARGLPRFKTKSEKAQEQRSLNVLLALLGEALVVSWPYERLLKDSYVRIDGDAVAAEDKLIRRRLQGIPAVAPTGRHAPKEPAEDVKPE